MESSTSPQQEHPHPQQELLERCDKSKKTLLLSLINTVTSTQCLMDKKDVEEILGVMGQVNDLLTKVVFKPHQDLNIVPASAQYWDNQARNAPSLANKAFCQREAYNHLVNHLYGLTDEVPT